MINRALFGTSPHGGSRRCARSVAVNAEPQRQTSGMSAQLIKRFYDVFVTEDRAPLYWDPMPYVSAVFAAQPQDGLWRGRDALSAKIM